MSIFVLFNVSARVKLCLFFLCLPVSFITAILTLRILIRRMAFVPPTFSSQVLCSTAQDPFPFFDKCTVPYIALWLSTFSPSLTAIIFASHSYIPILVLAVVLALSIMWVNEVLALLTEALDVYVFVITRKPSQEAKPGKKEN